MDASNYRIIGGLEITPNAYYRPELVTVRCERGAYIEVFSIQDGIERHNAYTYKKWYIRGKNTQLTSIKGDGYIYARLLKDLDTCDIIFSRHEYNPNGTAIDDPDIEKSDIYVYVRIGVIYGPTIASHLNRRVELSLGELSDTPEIKYLEGDIRETNRRVEEHDDIIQGLGDNVINLNEDNTLAKDPNYITQSDKKTLSIQKQIIESEYEKNIKFAEDNGVDENIINDYKYASLALLSMINHIIDTTGTVGLYSKLLERRLGVKYSVGTEHIGLNDYNQYDVAYVLPQEMSLTGWSDYTQVFSLYNSYKELITQDTQKKPIRKINDEIKSIKGAISYSDLSGITLASGYREIYDITYNDVYVGICAVIGDSGSPCTQTLISSHKIIFNSDGNIFVNGAEKTKHSHIYSRSWKSEANVFSGWREIGCKIRKPAFSGDKCVIVHKSIPIQPRKGAIYYFNNGIIKIRCNGKHVEGIDTLIGKGYLYCPNDGTITYSRFSKNKSALWKNVYNEQELDGHDFVYLKNQDQSLRDVIVKIKAEGILDLSLCEISYNTDELHLNVPTTTPYISIENAKIVCHKPMAEKDINEGLIYNNNDRRYEVKRSMWNRKSEVMSRRNGIAYMAVKGLKKNADIRVYAYRKCRNRLPNQIKIWIKAYAVVKRHRSSLFAEKRIYDRSVAYRPYIEYNKGV